MALSHRDFVDTYGPLADDISQATGLDPHVVLGVVAQETGWGNHFVGGNIFGISPGGQVASYGDVPAGARAFVDLVKSRYAGVSDFAPGDQPRALVLAGYNAADKGYAGKVGAAAKEVAQLRGGAAEPSADDLLKQVQGLRGSQQAPAAEPTTDELMQQVRGITPLKPSQAEPPTQAPKTPVDQIVTGELGGAAPPTIGAMPGATAAGERIAGAAKEAFVNAPSLGTRPGNMSVLTPEAQNWLDRNIPLVGPYVINPAARLVGTGIGAAAALGAAGAQAISEGTTALGQPALGRDINLLATSPELSPTGPLSVLTAAAPGPRVGAPGPKYAPGVGVVDPAIVERAGARSAVRDALEGPVVPAVSETRIAGPIGVPGSAPAMAARAAPQTAAEAKQIASSWYAAADKAGGELTPQFTNKFVDSVTASLPQTEAGRAVAGKSTVSELSDRLQSLRDKPMTLQAAQEVDEALGNLIDKEYGPRGITKEGKQIADVQRAFRDQIENAAPGDLVGGSQGFEALGNARQAWSQAMRMDDLERIRLRAEMTDNPATSFKTQIRTLLTNASRTRGYTPQELDALRSAADRGTLGSLLHVFGSRLVPLAAGAVGFGTGPLSGLLAAGGAHVASTVLRNAATGVAESRMNNAMRILGRRVPQPPDNYLVR